MEDDKKNKDEKCCSYTCLRYSLCVYNFIFLLSGCVICGLGVWTLLEKSIFIQLLTNFTYKVAVWLLISTGLLSVLTSLLGYSAVAWQSRGLLALYTLLLVVVFMFESVIGLLCYVYQDQIEPDLHSSLPSTFINTYGSSEENTRAVDKIQQQYACCGSSSYKDWMGSPWQLENAKMRVPDSCCKTVTEGCGMRDHPSNIPYTGCIHRFGSELTLHLFLLGSISFGIAILQVPGILLTSCLFSKQSKRTVNPASKSLNGCPSSSYQPVSNGSSWS